MSTCPKCNHARAPGAHVCPACGLVYDKYNPSRAAELEAIRARTQHHAPGAHAAPAVGSRVELPGNVAVCTTCAAIGQVRVGRRVNRWIFVLLLLCYVVPGVIYYLWCKQEARPVCGACGSNSLVPAETPAGRRIVADQMPAVSIVAPAIPQKVITPMFGKALGVVMAIAAIAFTGFALGQPGGASFFFGFYALLCAFIAWKGLTGTPRTVPAGKDPALINWVP